MDGGGEGGGGEGGGEGHLFMSVLMTYVAINYEKRLKKESASKYFLEVKVVVIRTNAPSMINHILPSLFLELAII